MRRAACTLLTILGAIGTASLAPADGLTFATWNVADLHHETGVALRERSVAREDVDYARLAATAKRIAGDVIALQEIGSPAALERIFPSADYHLIMSDRYGRATRRDRPGKGTSSRLSPSPGRPFRSFRT
ncbi:MAG: hypothetical protein F4103_00345 [Boseongicola sp. SB0673_bin_14]|nr:hypothetical protein [Boseongicola sp. SB0667_bin_21]MYI67267.1 hypothetical protein [Boseongicola sp. SB0673_bin_14]